MQDQLLDTVSRLLERTAGQFSPLSAGVLGAAYLGISNDSRSFARKLDVAHALVLRECVALADEMQLLQLDDRKDRSQRLFYCLTPQGLALLAGVH